MNNLDYKKPSIFNFYFFVGLSLLISAWIEILLNDYLLSRLSLPLTLMTLIYWNVATPRNIGFLWTMLSGFVLDIFLGYLLGTHVLIFLLTSYFSQRYFHRFRALFLLQQSLIVAMIVFIYQSIFISISNFFSLSIILELFVLTIISSLFWPIIYGILRYLRIKLTYGQ
tara:strand:+ start:2590 stop:3096 length:507 start_codon:yes stop_codon:yes gene_type:complete